MLEYIDNMLRHLFVTTVPGITLPQQVRFQPPDDDWRTYISTLDQMALNVYLIELKENREMRNCGRTREVTLGKISEKNLLRWVDVHYLITAWGPPIPQHPAVEPTIAEHELLWNVTVSLMGADALTPIKIYSGALPAGFPALIADVELPTSILPRDGFAKHAEFWGTMPGHYHPWRPAVLLIVTLPVTQPVILISPMVTTRITEYGLMSGKGGTELWAEIGGTVYDATVAPPAEVPGASVSIADTSGVEQAATTTDSRGRFIFNYLRPGNYQLQFSATGHPAAAPRNIAVPSPTGEYNLQFT